MTSYFKFRNPEHIPVLLCSRIFQLIASLIILDNHISAENSAADLHLCTHITQNSKTKVRYKARKVQAIYLGVILEKTRVIIVIHWKTEKEDNTFNYSQ